MNAEQLKQKYPQATEMLDGLEGEFKVHYIRGNRTVHNSEDGTYYYNYEGVHIRVFPSLEMIIKWFFGTPEEEAEAEESITDEYSYSSYLSKIQNDSEVFLDKDYNVAFCDFTNKDFTPEELAKAKKLD